MNTKKLQALYKKLLKYFHWGPIYIRFVLKGNKKYFNVFTNLTKLERLLLYKLALSLPKNSVFVEIGSYLGASSTFLASAAREKNSILYCVDTWGNDAMSEGKKDTFNEFMKNTQRFRSVMIPLRGLSEEVAKTFNKKINLLFIDGDHSYKGVKKDVDSWFPRLKNKAIVIFHDVGWAESVQKVISEYVKPLAKKEISLPNMYAAFVNRDELNA